MAKLALYNNGHPVGNNILSMLYFCITLYIVVPLHCRHTAKHVLSHVEQSMQSAEQLNGATCKVLECQIAG